jgi:hypothetical protein
MLSLSVVGKQFCPGKVEQAGLEVDLVVGQGSRVAHVDRTLDAHRRGGVQPPGLGDRGPEAGRAAAGRARDADGQVAPDGAPT